MLFRLCFFSGIMDSVMADPTESVLEFIRQLPHSATELDKADGPWLIRRILDPQMGERLSFKVQLLSRVHRLFTYPSPDNFGSGRTPGYSYAAEAYRVPLAAGCLPGYPLGVG